MRRSKFLALILGSFAWTFSARAAEPANVWFVDSLVKVFPSDAAGKNRLRPAPGGARLTAPEFLGARNGHVSIQLALRSQTPLGAVTAEASPLAGPGGNAISSVKVNRVGYVVVGSHSTDTPDDELIGEAPGWFPDPLLDFPADVEARRTLPIWITVHVPNDAAPGIYRGSVTLRAGKRLVARAAYRLRVVAAAVPDERSLKVTNWFSLGDKVSRQFYGVRQFSPEWWALVENVARVFAEHRQNVILTPLMELVEPRLEVEGLRYDFGNFDRWVETFKKAGAVGFIEGSHLLGRAGSYEARLEIETVLVENGQVRRENLSPDDPRAERFLQNFLSALNAHLEEKGWKAIYYQHILDEAHGDEPASYARFAALVHRGLPGVETMDAVDAAHMPAELQEHCDIWVPQLGRFDEEMELIRRRIAGGHEVWFYTCLYPRGRYLNRLMDYPLLKTRLLHWLNFRLDLTGFLHWGGNYWTPEPMKDTQAVINDNTLLLPAGDAFIVYPDRARLSVASSIRVETMREGIEDYELLRALAKQNPQEAQRLARAAVASFTDYVRDPAAFRKIEKELLESLSKK